MRRRRERTSRRLRKYQEEKGGGRRVKGNEVEREGKVGEEKERREKKEEEELRGEGRNGKLLPTSRLQKVAEEVRRPATRSQSP